MENQNVINETNTAQIKINKVLYTGMVTTSGGRDGVSKSDDERLNKAYITRVVRKRNKSRTAVGCGMVGMFYRSNEAQCGNAEN